MKASLSGVKSDDVQISVTADMLTLRGEFNQEEEKKEKSYSIREHYAGMFERSIMLPTDV